MVAVGPPATSSLSLCLRCQLQQIVLRSTNPLPQTRTCRRALHSTSWRFESQHGQVGSSTATQNRPHDSSQAGRDYFFRRLNLNGTIRGKPGRRRRQSIASLPSTSLGRQAEVVLVQEIEEDVKAEPQEPAVHKADTTNDGLTVREIEQFVANQAQMPEQDEVNLSIDAMQPDGLFIESKEFEEIVQHLIEGYSLEQLAYYVASKRPEKGTPINGTSLFGFQQWRPGKTRLSRRHGAERTRQPDRVTKRVLAEQIIRSAWKVLVSQEEQRVGEIEVSLLSWQAMFLFDLLKNGRPSYEGGINSQTLLRASKVELDRSTNIMRITARRQDATEILSRLEAVLTQLRHKQIDLSVFEHLPGYHKWPSRFAHLFPPANITDIMQSTGTVIERAGATLSLYGSSDVALESAVRLLLSLLSLPSPKVVSTRIVRKTTSGDHQILDYPSGGKELRLCEHFDENIHERYRHSSLFRAVEPAGGLHLHMKSSEKSSPLVDSTICAQITDMLESQKADWPKTCGDQTSWQSLRRGDSTPAISTNFALMLHNRPGTGLKMRCDSAVGQDLVALHRAPGIPSLLQLFRPKSEGEDVGQHGSVADPGDRTLVAHFIPSPFGPAGLTNIGNLPTLQLAFTISSSSNRGQAGVALRRATLNMHESTLRLLLPEQASDVDIVQSDVRFASPGMLERNESLLAFRNRLKDTLLDGEGAISGLPEIMVTVPRPAAIEDVAGDGQHDSVSVQYLWQSLEEATVIDFVPRQIANFSSNLDPEIKEFLAEWPEHFVMRRIEVEAGTLGGRRTELHLIDLRNELPVDRETAPNSAASNEHDPAQLVRFAMGISALLTRANKGTFKLHRAHPGRSSTKGVRKN